MPLKILFPDLKKVDKIQLLWRSFFDIKINIIKNKWTSQEIKIKTKDELMNMLIDLTVHSWKKKII